MLNIITSQVRALARNRIGYALFSGVKATVFSFGKTLYVLWLQTTGLIFGAFTAAGVMGVGREYRAHGWHGNPSRLWISVIFTVVCLWLTVTSFAKARRTSSQKTSGQRPQATGQRR